MSENNTVHFSDKAMEALSHQNILFRKPYADGRYLCTIGEFGGAGDTLQDALDNAMALIEQRNVKVALDNPS